MCTATEFTHFPNLFFAVLHILLGLNLTYCIYKSTAVNLTALHM